LQDTDPNQLLFLHEVKSLYVGVTRVKRNLLFYESTESMEARIFHCLLVSARERGILTEDVDFTEDGSEMREALLVMLKSADAVKKYLSGFSIQGDFRTREEEAKVAEASGDFDEAAKLFFQNGDPHSSWVWATATICIGTWAQRCHICTGTGWNSRPRIATPIVSDGSTTCTTCNAGTCAHRMCTRTRVRAHA
jgi:hypothetical protein